MAFDKEDAQGLAARLMSSTDTLARWAYDVLRDAIEHIEELETSNTKLRAAQARYKLRVYPRDKPDMGGIVRKFSNGHWDLEWANRLEDGDIWLPTASFSPTPEEIAEAREASDA